MKNGPTANKIIHTQAEVIRHMRSTLLTVKKDAERSLDYAKRQGWKPHKVMEEILKRVEDEERYMMRKSIELDDLKRELPKGQQMLGGTL